MGDLREGPGSDPLEGVEECLCPHSASPPPHHPPGVSPTALFPFCPGYLFYVHKHGPFCLVSETCVCVGRCVCVVRRGVAPGWGLLRHKRASGSDRLGSDSNLPTPQLWKLCHVSFPPEPQFLLL